jgi:hypothetical protein
LRNRWRVLAFDILAPIAAVVALVYIGMVLAWPLWWVSACSVLCLLIVEGVGIASSVSEASATFTPQSPTASIDRAMAMMSPKSAEAFKNGMANVAKDLTSKNISAQANTVSVGVEAIGPDAASVAVILRATQNAPGKPTDTAVLALRVQLSKSDGRWLVDDVSPIHSR